MERKERSVPIAEEFFFWSQNEYDHNPVPKSANVEPIISKLPLPRGNKCYFVLCLAVKEAAILYPRYPNEISLEELCCRILQPAGKSTPGTVRRSLERAVEYIWPHGENNPALLAIYEHAIVEKLSARDFIACAARYICNHPPDHSGLWLTPTETSFRYLAEDGAPYFANPCDHPIVKHVLPAFMGGETNTLWSTGFSSSSLMSLTVNCGASLSLRRIPFPRMTRATFLLLRSSLHLVS